MPTRRFGLERSITSVTTGRWREFTLLTTVTVLLGFGWWSLWQRLDEQAASAALGLNAGTILNLNTIEHAEALAGVFASLPFKDRTFIAETVIQVRKNGFANVGELRKIRVPISTVQQRSDLEHFHRRLKEIRNKEHVGESISLISARELRRAKPFLVVRSPDDFRRWLGTASLMLVAAFFIVHLSWRFLKFRGDPFVLPLLFGLSGIGFLTMVSIHDPLRDTLRLTGFAHGVLVGLVLLVFTSRLDVERLGLLKAPFFALGMALCLSTALVIMGSGPSGSDAKVNLFGFQPVELIKVLVIVFLAGYFQANWEFLRVLREDSDQFSWLGRLGVPRFTYLLPVFLGVTSILIFFFLQRDLGPALIMAFIFLILYGIARNRLGLPLMGFGLLLLGFYIGYQIRFPTMVANRISMWMSPWDTDFEGGDHLAGSLWAFASGAWTGTGLGLGRSDLLPAVHTDMVLAAVGEELGALGTVTTLALFALLTIRFLLAACRASSKLSFFLAIGFTLLLALQAILITAGALGLAPLTGIASPFLSYGRTSMMINLGVAGFLIAISARPGTQKIMAPFRNGIFCVVALLTIAFGALLVQIIQIQIIAADSIMARSARTLQADGERRLRPNPRLRAIALEIPRGTIRDRNGVVLATNDRAELEQHLESYSHLRASIPSERPPGGRFYPFGGFTFHLLGNYPQRTNWGAPNSSYLERDQDSELRGWRSYTELVPLWRHRSEPDHPTAQVVLSRDRDLQTTIDIRFQVRLARRLAERVNELGNVDSATVVVVDPATGDVLASVNHPHPSPPKTSKPTTLLDRSRYGLYPPGSSFKLVTAVAALRKDPLFRTRKFECVALRGRRVGTRIPGWGRAIRDDVQVRAPHGPISMQRGVRHSCNAYFAQLGVHSIGAHSLLQTAQLFGIRAAVPNTAEQLGHSLPQSSFGQGQVVASPLRMALVAATIAADGQLPAERWILNGAEVARARMLPRADARFLAATMREVVALGTAKRISDVVPPIAGKTGTAEVLRSRPHAWFVGFAPYQGHRQIAFSVLFENGGYGGRVAAPFAAEVVEMAVDLGLVE